MTPRERSLLSGFLSNLTAARVDSVDAEADEMIRKTIANQPQASYLLVQQALTQQMALNEARTRIGELEEQIDRGRAAHAEDSGFLGDAHPGGNRNGGSPTPNWGGPTPNQAPPQTGGRPGAGVGDFLRTAATTAAGVAGGALLFQGIEHLFGGGGGGPSGDFLKGSPTELIENTTIVNDDGDDADRNLAGRWTLDDLGVGYEFDDADSPNGDSI